MLKNIKITNIKIHVIFVTLIEIKLSISIVPIHTYRMDEIDHSSQASSSTDHVSP